MMKAFHKIACLAALFSLAACDKNEPSELLTSAPEPAEVYQKTILIEPITSVGCGACPLAHHEIESLEDSLPEVIHITHYLYGPLSHPYTAYLLETIDKTVYTPVAHIQRDDHGDGVVYFTVDRFEEMVEGMLLSIASMEVKLDAVLKGDKIEIISQISADDPTLDSVQLNVVVLENSVTKSGPGYNQRNYGHTDPSHPYYGQGEEITNFEHTNVIRHVLTPFAGQPLALSGGMATKTYDLSISDLTEPLGAYSVIAFVAQNAIGPAPIHNAAKLKLEDL